MWEKRKALGPCPMVSDGKGGAEREKETQGQDSEKRGAERGVERRGRGGG